MKSKANVFIVEDNADVQKATTAILTAHQYVVQCFSTAEAFLEEYEPDQVGCVIIDLQLPGMKGDELARQLHRENSLLSIVVISGDLVGNMDSPLEVGSAELLEKPYQIPMLLRLVEEGVARSYRRRAER